MKRGLLLIIAIISYIGLSAQTDRDIIEDVVSKSYVLGIHNGGDISYIESGFHPGFEMLGIGQDSRSLTKLPIYTWLDNIKQSREAGRVPTQETKSKFVNVDITGKSAVVKLELYREDKLIFTDYIMLYKFDSGWKIVSKIYNRH